MEKESRRNQEIIKNLQDSGNKYAETFLPIEQSIRLIGKKFNLNEQIVDALIRATSENVEARLAGQVRPPSGEDAREAMKMAVLAAFTHTIRTFIPNSSKIEEEFEFELFGDVWEPPSH